MDPFDIVVNGKVLTIWPNEDGTYDVFDSGTRIATLYADVSISTSVIWETGDLIPAGYAQMIGEAIERFEQ